MFGKCGSKVTRIDKLYSTGNFFPLKTQGGENNLATVSSEDIDEFKSNRGSKEAELEEEIWEELEQARGMGVDSVRLAEALHNAGKSLRNQHQMMTP